jgi:hypothetical protein
MELAAVVPNPIEQVDPVGVGNRDQVIPRGYVTRLSGGLDWAKFD